MNAQKRTAGVQSGLSIIDSMMRSRHQDQQMRILDGMASKATGLITVDFELAPMYAIWYRRQCAGWYAISQIHSIEVALNVPAFQDYYDSVVLANASSGKNMAIKNAYDALYGELDGGTVADLPSGGYGNTALYNAILAYAEDGEDIQEWVRKASAKDARRVENALLDGTLRSLSLKAIKD